MRDDVSTNDGGLSRLRRVDLNLLLTLQVLLEERSVTRAATRLHVGQPAVSGALGRLRRILDDELLVRVGRSMHPTPRAESLLEPLTEILRSAEVLLWPLEPFDPRSVRREIRIILGDYEEIVLIPELTRRLADEAPGVSIKTMSPGPDSRASLERGSTDLWITPFDQRWLDLPFETVLRDRWVGVGCATAWAEQEGTRHGGGPRPGLVLRSAPDGAYPRDSTFRRDRFADPLDIEYSSAHSAAIPFLVAGTRRVGVMPERLARLLQATAGIRILTWRQLDPIQRVVQWHPRHTVDPFNAWIRELLASSAEEAGSA